MRIEYIYAPRINLGGITNGKIYYQNQDECS